MRGRVRGKYRDSGESIEGEYGEDGRVKSGGVAIFVGFSGQVGLLVGNLCRVEVVRLGEELPGLGKTLDLFPGVLVNLLKFVEVFHEFQTVVRTRRQVVERPGVIRVRVSCTITRCRRDITVVIVSKFRFRAKAVRWSCAICI